MASERQAIDKNDPWWGEHVHRYDEALKYIKNTDTVLDIACGTGFGSHILAQNTEGVVVGGDIASDAVVLCQKSWQKENLQFKVLDGTNLAFEDAYFDMVVSFETIEHTTQYRKMLAEFRRVLKPNGYLILSTPNQKMTSPDSVIHNQYHTQEFHFDELEKLLKAEFTSVSLMGQYCSRYEKSIPTKPLAQAVESLLLLRGVRKLPYSFRSGLMKSFFNIPLYNQPDDFNLSDNKAFVEANCPVLFAICRKIV